MQACGYKPLAIGLPAGQFLLGAVASSQSTLQTLSFSETLINCGCLRGVSVRYTFQFEVLPLQWGWYGVFDLYIGSIYDRDRETNKEILFQTAASKRRNDTRRRSKVSDVT